MVVLGGTAVMDIGDTVTKALTHAGHTNLGLGYILKPLSAYTPAGRIRPNLLAMHLPRTPRLYFGRSSMPAILHFTSPHTVVPPVMQIPRRKIKQTRGGGLLRMQYNTHAK